MSADRGHWMAAEIAEQPMVVAGVLARRAAIELALEQARRPWSAVALCGRGSSENAAWFGRTLFEEFAGLPAEVCDIDSAFLLPSDALAVFISQSGRTRSVVGVADRLRRAGHTVVALTNDAHSDLARVADVVVDMAAGVERAVPATKTFTATLAGLLVLADDFRPVEGLRWLPTLLRKVAADDHRARTAAAQLHHLDGWACVGTGLFEPIAREAALKLEEAALVVADHHSAPSFRHGPIATAGPRRPVLALAGPPDDPTWTLVRDLREMGSPVVVVAASRQADLRLPEAPDALSPVLAAVRVQQLALALALRRGANPDRPPRLSKVTVA